MDPDVEFCLHGVAHLVQDGDMNASAVVVLVLELLDGTVDANADSRLIGVELLHESADRAIGDGVAHEVEAYVLCGAAPIAGDLLHHDAALKGDLCLATVFSTLWLPGSDNLAKEPPMPQISAFPSIKALSILLLVPLNSTSLPWWTTLSIIAEASLSSPRIVPHLLNSMLVVNTTLRFS